MILVTGGTGLVGSHLLFELTQKQKVRALVRNGHKKEKVKHVFSYYTDTPDKYFDRIEWVKGNILDYHSLEEAMEDVDKVYHCAAIVSFDPSDKRKVIRDNVKGAANVVNACIAKGINKICHVSSIAALGIGVDGAVVDEDTHWQPGEKRSQYSVSKFRSELEVWRASSEGLNTVIVNPGVILGPGFWEEGSGRLFKTSYEGLKFYTEGVTGYVDVKDVAKAAVVAMESETVNERFVLVSENVTYRKLFQKMAAYYQIKEPGIKVTPFIANTAWRVMKLRQWFTGKKPMITKETAKTSLDVKYFSSDKFKKSFDFDFIPVSQSIQEYCKLYMKDRQLSA